MTDSIEKIVEEMRQARGCSDVPAGAVIDWADRIEALVKSPAKHEYRLKSWPEWAGFQIMNISVAQAWLSEPGQPWREYAELRPLYAAPPLTDADAQDAARFRWLVEATDFPEDVISAINEGGSLMRSTIDAAIAQREGER